MHVKSSLKMKYFSLVLVCFYQGLKMLTRLYLDGNLLESVPSDLPPSLQELKISENRLRGVHDNSFEGLKLQNTVIDSSQ